MHAVKKEAGFSQGTVRKQVHKIIKKQRERDEKTVSRKLIIDGNAVYEIDEECMLKKQLREPETGGTGAKEQRDTGVKNQSENKDVR